MQQGASRAVLLAGVMLVGCFESYDARAPEPMEVERPPQRGPGSLPVGLEGPPPQEFCNDGIDNDLDGDADCYDEDCIGTSACTEVCDDGIDNDVDGDVDCGDRDCRDEHRCAEICDDGIDNNSDGFTDCDDVLCDSRHGCVEVCDDGIDNDVDGLADCRDRDCFGVEVCAEVCGDGIDNDLDNATDCFDSDCDNDDACPEVCDDGIDNDGDGWVDCRDGGCEGTVECTEVCDDGVDNNRNGRVDCADPGCADALGCVEICDDGIDNDADHFIDCEDDGCRLSPECPLTCGANDLGQAIGVGVVAGSTLGAQRFLTPWCSPLSGPERSYRWTAPAAGTFNFSITTNYDGVISIRDIGCTEEFACNDESPDSSRSSVTLPVARGDERIILIDGNGYLSRGDFELDIEREGGFVEGPCTDHVDNDGDELVDCDDEDECEDPTYCMFICGGEDLGSLVGSEVASGTTAGETDSIPISCASRGGADSVYTWTAPVSGPFVFWTLTPEHDGALAVFESDCLTELSCNDDFGGRTRSRVLLMAEAGTPYGIVVDGFGGAVGDYSLRIVHAPDFGSERCDDGIDNDYDDQLDCEDLDCRDAPECREE